MPNNLLPCRITIMERSAIECWDITCTGCDWKNSTDMPVEALEVAYEHYRSTPHRGVMFIDFRPEVILNINGEPGTL